MVNESVLDPIQKTRCKDLFIGPDYKTIKTKVKNQILDTLYKWLKKMGFDYEEVIKDIYIEGSSVGFQYTDTADIDVSVYTNIPDEKINNLWNILPNGKNVEGTTMPINYYLMRQGSKNLNTTDNCYDLLNDKWIKEQKLEEVSKSAPFSYVMEIAKFFISGINNRIQEYETDNTELEYIKDLTEAEIKEEEKKKMISEKEEEIKSDLDAIYVGHCMLKAMRHQAFGKKEKNEPGWYPHLIIDIKQDEQDDPNHSISNLIYKVVEKMGFDKKLEEYEEKRKKFLK